ncbi:efflux RND transporter permease subunit [Flavobacterium sp. MC2016-06]|jgi:multidrug efflux pump subunit AcrB|uniref:efflux RND transporter permease subunit n=1 Tax=Flavobacterium sp. MC2016-06 TaxID=2676308 RepID=UPI0012BAD75C|nr:efflux RND transporter permease subunit [Flavobacterium sp. MC2016-06]MBU3860641.1 efflux RND transporter permease subunit [Flavobacterium sp. MC2016-06]
MNLISFALKKPIAIMVIVAAMFFFGIKAVKDIKIDLFPKLDLPVIYISHPFGGYTPEQMEAYFGKTYIGGLLYVNGIKSIETKNIQGLTFIKINFYPGTNMAQAAAEVTAFSNRMQVAFPPNSSPPFIIRFDVSTLPVGQLVLSSKTRPQNELLDLANVYVRSSFTNIPGLVGSAPFGGNVRTVVINADPDKLRAHNMSADQLVAALRLNNQPTPAGNVRIGDKNYLTPANTSIKNIKDFEDIPLFSANQASNLYLRDVATATDGTDVNAGYALVNGKRSVYINIAKSADASTWDVVSNLKKALPQMQAQLPEDVKLSYEFDQSGYVMNSVKGLLSEGVIGAVLTGLMVMLFLGDIRGGLIVVLTIPISIITGVLFLNLFGQTINLMTLSGLALAIGILVDESTVTIENIHQHLDMGKPKALAIWHACKEIALPKLLILLCILAVFAPAFTMGGIPGSLFLPLALAIGFSMIASYFLSQTFVPVMANWIMKGKENKEESDKITDPEKKDLNNWTEKEKLLHLENDPNHKLSLFEKLRIRYMTLIDRIFPYRKSLTILYILLIGGIAAVLFVNIGRDVLPKVDGRQFQIRMRVADGTRIEKTELKAIKLLNVIKSITGEANIAVTSTFIGNHPQQLSTASLFLWMGGPHEAVLQVALKEGHGTTLDELKDEIRKRAKKSIPDAKLSFEPIELTDKVLSQGSPTPIEVRFSGRNKKINEQYAAMLIEKLKKIPYLRDVQLGQSIHYPVINIDINRTATAQLGTDINAISRSLTASTSSTRMTEKNIWIDPKTNQSYSVQVQVPESKMSSQNDIASIPLLSNNSRPLILADVAKMSPGTTYGEAYNLGAMPMLTVTANINDMDLGTAGKDVRHAVENLGELPRGLSVELIGLSQTLIDTLSSLEAGLMVAIVVIFLMLAANFQSFKVSLVILTTIPAVMLGALGLLSLCGSTLNLQSYMGMIMSVGVSISNAVLLITNAEQLRRINGDAALSAKEAASLRLRPILMTALAMVMGMIPMALGIGEAGDQSSPLGRAVIGGLIASTFATLFILPLVFAWAQGKTSTQSVSLHPIDEQSIHYIAGEQ